jgi:hypothetical protein
VNSDTIAAAYLRYFEAKQPKDEWAVAAVDTLVRQDPHGAWKVVGTMINTAGSEEALAYVAAGPLEDLLNLHGGTVISNIEQDCSTNERLRLALSGVWIGPDNPVFERWYALMWKHGFADGKREPL